MKPDAFDQDLSEAEALLRRAEKVGRVGRLLTLGLWSNQRSIEHARSLRNAAQAHKEELLRSTSTLSVLRKRMAESLEVRGVRVAKYVFADLLLDGRQTYGPEWEALRGQILERDERTCQHADGSCRGPLQIHHIVWLSRGGSNDPSNLVTLCRYHHGLQHPGNPAFVD